METPTISLSLLLFLLFTISSSIDAHSHGHTDFLQCLFHHSKNSSEISSIIHTPQNSSYSSILQSSIRNLRFTSSTTPRPLLILTPHQEPQIQAIVRCARDNGLQLRTRSGGHDYEGLSYTSRFPFIVLDLVHMTEIKLDVARKTAWVQSGATIGQLYYKISKQSTTLAFPSGTCPTVGVGGHFSGGGYGSLLRKYGLAADNIVDARLIDAEGRILDRESMGEDLFWAIRGGGGASFGVITAWKVNLVDVPKIVTIFSVNKSMDENAAEIVHKWQYVAPIISKDLFLSITINRINSTTFADFRSMFLGRADKLLELLTEKFPELGLKMEDCNEVSWIQSALFFGGYDVGSPPHVLASRVPLTRLYFKAKSDYIKDPVPKTWFKDISKLLQEKEADMALLILTPYGGRMSEIPESSIPFPHRAGNLYKIQHLVYWDEAGREASRRYISWIRRLYRYMGGYVSKFPRSAYVNYRDLDLGVNNEGNHTSYAQASVWGLKYFNGNFDRLVRIKSVVDPTNFFRNEQSIPPY